uniref:Uncharacterized protein MANES_01G103500 n=1 Tax=Rhizophora mucronata TaxID=61149 RepID=A0A2P2K8D7_RHIMU
MGAVCCCLSTQDIEDYMNPNSSVYRNCMCLSCFVQNFLHMVCLFLLSCLSSLLFLKIIIIIFPVA